MKHIYNSLLLIVPVVIIIFLTGCGGDKTVWQQEKGYKWAELPDPSGEKAGFVAHESTQTGIRFVNDLTEEQLISNRHLLDGSGVALGDVDNDGLCDIYFCRLNGANILYRNLGNFRFQDITDSAGVAYDGQFSKGAVFADIDGDADLDLLITVLDGPNACFINDGSGKFTERTAEYGLSSLEDRTGNTSMTLGDIDGDGDLDLYMVSYKFKSRRDIEAPEMSPAGLVRAEPDNGERDILYINDGTGHFKDADLNSDRFIREDNVPDVMPRAWGLSAQMQDIDDDGDPDIYVCNDFTSPDFIWINDGTGRFRAIERLAIRTTSSSSMTVDFSDIDRDGNVDFFVADMLSRDHKKRKMQMGEMARTNIQVGMILNRPQVMRNTMFHNRGDGTFAEIGNYSGVYASDWTWSGIFADIDLDGYEDLLVTTGHAYDVQDYDAQKRILKQKVSTIDELRRTVLMYPRLETKNYLFRNNQDLTFTEAGEELGFADNGISHGMALADLDNDGDQDVVLNNYQSPAGIYENRSPASRIAVRLSGDAPNTQGVGAKITLTGGPVVQSKEIKAGGHYLSGSEAMAVFAAGDADTEKQLEVRWRSGRISRISGVKAGCIYEIAETSATETSAPPNPAPEPYFADESAQLGHIHFDYAFNDFYRQPLLPNQLSQLGPGVTWYDLDQDNDDDLIISTGRDGKMAVYRNDLARGFSRVKDKFIDGPAGQDQTAVLAFRGLDGQTSLLAGLANYEDTGLKPVAAVYPFQAGRFGQPVTLPTDLSSTGPLALSDYDLDGDLDLFVGGRVIGGKYPDPASSGFYRNENGKFVPDTENSQAVKRLGLVSGAVFSDFDLDGDADLLLALEWGPVMLFRNDQGRFVNITQESGLDKYTGWWNGITTGDLNGDGRMDIIATNWGLNSKYHYNPDHPLRIYYDDFDNNGVLDIVEAHYDPFYKSIMPERGYSCMSRAMPFIKNKIGSFEQYGGSELREIIGPGLQRADSLSAATLEHMVFLNHGDRFEAMAMPAEAQFSPAFYAGVADFDGDGNEDVFIAQNFFATQPETPRIDAGRGLWLWGDGTGKLRSVPGQESGIMVYGEQRGGALSDYDRDGRVDLVVSQNGAETKLYRNVRGIPGLRVKLTGAKGDADCVGAIVRLQYADHSGPAKEIHSGSGYWSQDSHTLVFGAAEGARKVIVHWPGGQVTETIIPADVGELVIDRAGGLAAQE